MKNNLFIKGTLIVRTFNVFIDNKNHVFGKVETFLYDSTKPWKRCFPKAIAFAIVNFKGISYY